MYCFDHDLYILFVCICICMEYDMVMYVLVCTIVYIFVGNIVGCFLCIVFVC